MRFLPVNVIPIFLGSIPYEPPGAQIRYLDVFYKVPPAVGLQIMGCDRPVSDIVGFTVIGAHELDGTLGFTTEYTEPSDGIIGFSVGGEEDLDSTEGFVVVSSEDEPQVEGFISLMDDSDVGVEGFTVTEDDTNDPQVTGFMVEDQ